MGKGVDKDYEQAGYWFEKAADQGDSFAQGRLGYLYLAGLGVNKDTVKAYAWFKLATLNKNEEAGQELKRLEATISPQEKEAGEKFLQELQSKKLAAPTLSPSEGNNDASDSGL